MAKIKKGLVQEVKQKQNDEEKQRKLREKHFIDDNVIVVEKSNTMKFTVKTMGSILKIFAGSILIVLASVGTCTLLYPTLRIEFIAIVQEFMMQLGI